MKNLLHLPLILLAGALPADAMVTLLGGGPNNTVNLALAAATTLEYAKFVDVQVGDVLVMEAASNRSIEQVTFTYNHTLTVGGTATVSSIRKVNTEEYSPELQGQAWIWYTTVTDVSGGTEVTFSLSHDGAANSSIHAASFLLREDEGYEIRAVGNLAFKQAVTELLNPFSIPFSETVNQGMAFLAASSRPSAMITTPQHARRPQRHP